MTDIRHNGDPVVLVLGASALSLETGLAPEWESTRLTTVCYQDEDKLYLTLAELRPDVIVTLGDLEAYPEMHRQSFEVRKRWLHYGTADFYDLDYIGAEVWNCYLSNILAPREDPPLVSVFTPVYNGSLERMVKAHNSLCVQSYQNWEWVIVDDGSENEDMQGYLAWLAQGDSRVRVATMAHRGVIGAVKHDAAALCKGSILVELDYDDTLRWDTLAQLVHTFTAQPEVGFVFSDFIMVDDQGNTRHTFGDTWGFGYGETYEYRGSLAHGAPINATTIRHIVAAPNHVRAWRSSVYWQIGGHNRELAIADDYELIVRTFLATTMFRIKEPLYTQYVGSTTTDARRKAIQRLVRYIASHYESAIHNRLLELGMEDSYA